MQYYVEYNSKFIAIYKTIMGCLNFIERKGLENDYNNSLRIFDQTGEEYNPINGKQIKYN